MKVTDILRARAEIHVQLKFSREDSLQSACHKRDTITIQQPYNKYRILDNIMGVYKAKKRNKNGSNENKENQVPHVDSDSVKAAALIRLIDTFVHTKPRFSVPECMRHAGLPDSVVRNTTIQQRVRRLVKKLDLPSVIVAMDESLLERHGIEHIPSNTREQAYYTMLLKAAVLVYLIESQARSKPQLSIQERLLFVGLTPAMANDPTTQPLLLKLADLVSLEDVLVRVGGIVSGKPQNVLGPAATVTMEAATAR